MPGNVHPVLIQYICGRQVPTRLPPAEERTRIPDHVQCSLLDCFMLARPYATTHRVCATTAFLR